jgi:hypothetical protein
MQTIPEMRRVKFKFYDRLVLVPMELKIGMKYLAAVLLLNIIISLFRNGFSFVPAVIMSIPASISILMAYLTGTVLSPLLLPWLPGRRFSMKGFNAGLLTFIAVLLMGYAGNSMVSILGWFFVITSISSFLMMCFTGSSTYTSLSGVMKEMKVSLPLQLLSAVSGLVLLLVGVL